MTALRVVLLADHGGLPAGTDILIGHAEASSSTPVATAHATTAPPAGEALEAGRPAGVPPKKTKPLPKPPEPKTGRRARSSSCRPPTSRRRSRRRATSSPSTARRRSPTRSERRAPVSAGITARTSSPRSAPRSSPSPTAPIFSVGWNDRGGYRLWLRDRQGNQFYYAHLSAFSPLAVDGREVRAGAVIGFVGNTGDAQSTPYHLHFEIHPVGLLPMGYDGVVNSFPYLSAWRRLEDVVVRRRPRLGAAGAADRDGAEAGSAAARLDRHLERERARAGLARAGARRSGLSRRRRRPDPIRLALALRCRLRRRRRVRVVVGALAGDLLHQPLAGSAARSSG